MTGAAGRLQAWARALARDVEARLRAVARPERAPIEKAYLKSALEHLGASMPALRKVAVGLRRERPELGHDEVVALAEALWEAPIHERRAIVVELLDVYGDRLGAGDLALLERLLRESRTWALVDGLAATVVGAIVEREGGRAAVGRTLDRWARDPDFWVRRAALLALLRPLRAGAGDFERFGRYADAMLEEKEFFIRKAIGWVLRDASKRSPARVHAWLLPRAARASGVTVREAVKHLAPAPRAEILAAFGAGRPRSGGAGRSGR